MNELDFREIGLKEFTAHLRGMAVGDEVSCSNGLSEMIVTRVEFVNEPPLVENGWTVDTRGGALWPFDFNEKNFTYAEYEDTRWNNCVFLTPKKAYYTMLESWRQDGAQ